MSGRWVISLAAIAGGAIVGTIISGGAVADSLSDSISNAVVGAVVGALGGLVLLGVILWVPSVWREHRRIALGVTVIAAVLATTLVVWDRTPRPSSLEAVVINLDVGRYKLSIRGNGDVTYVGHRNVPVLGRQTARISQAEVARFVEAFYESGFFTMPDSGCGGILSAACAGRPITDTTISFDGFSRKVHTGRSAPDGLFRLQDKIAAVAVANGWLTRAR